MGALTKTRARAAQRGDSPLPPVATPIDGRFPLPYALPYAEVDLRRLHGRAALGRCADRRASRQWAQGPEVLPQPHRLLGGGPLDGSLATFGCAGRPSGSTVTSLGALALPARSSARSPSFSAAFFAGKFDSLQ